MPRRGAARRTSSASPAPRAASSSGPAAACPRRAGRTGAGLPLGIFDGQPKTLPKAMTAARRVFGLSMVHSAFERLCLAHVVYVVVEHAETPEQALVGQDGATVEVPSLGRCAAMWSRTFMGGLLRFLR